MPQILGYSNLEPFFCRLMFKLQQCYQNNVRTRKESKFSKKPSNNFKICPNHPDFFRSCIFQKQTFRLRHCSESSRKSENTAMCNLTYMFLKSLKAKILFSTLNAFMRSVSFGHMFMIVQMFFEFLWIFIFFYGYLRN